MTLPPHISPCANGMHVCKANTSHSLQMHCNVIICWSGSALCVTLIKAITIAACHSKLQSIMYDVPERMLQLTCHLGDVVSDAVHCKQTFLVVRQLQCVVACVCLQQERTTHIITPGNTEDLQIHHHKMLLCLLIQAFLQAQKFHSWKSALIQFFQKSNCPCASSHCVTNTPFANNLKATENCLGKQDIQVQSTCKVS